MKFGYAGTSGEAPAPPEKRSPALPRPPACLRNSNWAASPQRACFCLLGASEFGSDILMAGFDPPGPQQPRTRRQVLTVRVCFTFGMHRSMQINAAHW